MQTVVRVALGTFFGMWAFVISVAILVRIFGAAILGLVLGAAGF